MKNKLTFERANELLRYEPETGKLFWKVNRRGPAKAGDEAGSVQFDNGPDRTPYRAIRVEGKRHMAHRLAWLLRSGAWPEQQIDHLDGDGLNNRIENLRDVSKSVNARNQKMHANNTSGITGVAWNKIEKKWQAQISIDGKRSHYLGRFENIEDAETAVKNFRLLHGYTTRHGEKKICS